MEFELLVEETTPLLTNQGELNESGKKKPSPWYIIIPVFTLSFAYGYEWSNANENRKQYLLTRLCSSYLEQVLHLQ